MDTEQLEALALSDDRTTALAQLVAGSEDHDYWRAIDLQHRGALAEVDAILATWPSHHGHTDRFQRLQRRQRLLLAGVDLARHAAALTDELGVSHEHQPETETAAQRYPSVLAPTRIDEAALVAQALARGPGLDGLTAWGRHGLDPRTLDATRRRQYLERLERAGLPGLVEAIDDDLGERSSRGFGSLPIHHQLTAADLAALAARRPTLRADPAWVAATVARLRPADHVDWSDDVDARIAYLDAVLAALAPLPQVFAPHRALVLYHRLACDLRTGQFDRARLRAYLALPRSGASANRAITERYQAGTLVAIDGGFMTAVGLPAVGDDLAVVRPYVHALLRDDDGADLAELLDGGWLTRARAEVRLLAGATDPRWAGQLGADAVAALRDRVDLELAPTNPSRWGRDGEVAVTVAIKNVPTLRVRVFRINTAAWFHAHGADVDPAIDLDGLAAGWEETRELPQAPMVRHDLRLALPACAEPGVYVVELIGGGRASRALIRRGDLRCATRPTAAGIAVDVVDERGQACPGASVWMGGRAYPAGASGAITLPFSTRPGSTPVLLVDGDVAVAARVELRAETYQFTAAWLLDRQAVIPGETARAVVRLDLAIGGAPVSLAVLEDAYVEIATTDRRDVTAKQRQPLVVGDPRDAVVEIPVPVDVRDIALAVGGRVRVVSEQRTIDVRADHAISVGTIHAGLATGAVYLRPGADGLRLVALGKSGEARGGRALALRLRARAVTQPVDVVLATDELGEVFLGPLRGIEAISATLGDVTQEFRLDALAPTAPTAQIVAAGTEVVVLVATARGGEALAAQAWSLVELRGGVPTRDCAAQVRAEPGRLIVSGLAPGRYRAWAAGVDHDLIVVPAATPVARGWAALPHALVEIAARRPTTATVTGTAAGDVEIAISDASPHTRVHVLASALAPAPAADPRLTATVRGPQQHGGALGRATYLSGRDIGDEYRYVLDRQRQGRRAGVLLDKPSLLLNPWALRATSTSVQEARRGGGYPSPAPAPSAPMRAASMAGYGGAQAASIDPAFAAYDFLAAGPIVLANLAPDADGTLTVAAAALGAATQVHVVVVDPSATTAHRLQRAGAPLAVRDLRLASPLPLDRHVREDRRLVAAPAGAAITVVDRATSRVELVDTVDKLYRALCALSGDATLASWDFLARWPSLPEAERLSLYSRHACHELALFIYGKDRPLFDRAIKPYLAAKLHPTFIDRWLTDADLRADLEPWRLARLNALELALLARRHPEVGPLVHRRLADAVELLAPDPGADDRLVDTIVAGGALAGDGLADEFAAAEAEPMLELARGITTEGVGGLGGGGAAAKARPKAKKGAMRSRSADRADDDESDDVVEREEQAPLFRAADRTQEWAEHNWWQRRVESVDAALIPAARLWRDLAGHPGGRFLSPHVVDAAASLPAAMAALAFIDLPFAAARHAVVAAGAGATLTAGSDAIAAVIEVAAVAGPPNQQVLIGQSYFRADDRWTWDGAEQIEKYVTGELLVGVVYACQIVVTNPTSRTQQLAVLHQIPVGAIAVGGAIATATTRCRLEPYQSTTVEYPFYFPRAGGFDHYGAQVTRAAGAEPVLMAAIEPRRLIVVAVPSTVDAGSWPHLAQRGSLDEVCHFLAERNLGRVDLEAIAWRCRDRAAFERITAALAGRGVLDATLWSYALVHHDRVRAGEWLAALGADLGDVGPTFASPLVTWEPVERATYQHLEYAPLINARAHRLGDRRTILNDGLARQWQQFLEQVGHRPRPRAEDFLAASHYLFAMDRPDDAIGYLARADDGDAPAALQRDYLQAYAAIVAGDLAAARARIAAHLEHPVDRWRTRFAALAALLDEAGGAAAAPVTDPDSREQALAAAARQTPTVAVRVDGDAVVLDHAGVERAQVRYYRMDLELLFSRQPFFGADGGRFGFIAPGRVDEVELAAVGPTRCPLPVELRRHSLVIEAVAGGARAATTHFAHELAVTVTAPYGRVQVRHAGTGAARTAAYVKCYARLRGGAVQFYKDGYTDLCGRFDYATLSTDDLDRVERFALLVVDDAAGATVVEATPPVR
ncbi:MAG: hypothetical protein IPL61_36190 [Myxococcales bacterium]|nr:hypothetical protein [Myxococcales bacterium]